MRHKVKALRHNPAGGEDNPHDADDSVKPTAPVRKVRPTVSGDSSEQTSPSPERMNKTILLPTDFSPGDNKVIQQAVALARVLEARLTLLHVIDVNDPAWLKFAGSSDEFMRQLRTKAHAEMHLLVESLADEPIEVGSLIVEGLPCEEIAQRTPDFDLVIVSRPRPERFWRLFSKRTAQRVIDRAECGVLAVRE